MPLPPESAELRRQLFPLDAEQLDLLIRGEFPAVFANLAPGQSLDARRNALIAYAERQMQVPNLISAIEKYKTRQTNYHPFDLRLRSDGRFSAKTAGTARYVVEVDSDLAGQASAEISFDLHDTRLERLLQETSLSRGSQFVGNAMDRTVNAPRAEQTGARVESMSELGRRLFEIAFPGPIARRFEVALNKIEANEALRLRLRVDATELAVLPWELMFDSERDQYLALSRRVSLVRFWPAAEPIEPLLLNPPLRILVAVASPADQLPLRVNDEIASLQDALNPLGNLVSVEVRSSFSYVDLVSALNENFQAIHFIGHGTFDVEKGVGALVFEKEGRSDFVDAQMLGHLLAGTSVRLLFLNACQTAETAGFGSSYGVAQTLVKAGLPAVLAMQTTVLDDVAVVFSQQFYRALAQRLPLDACVRDGRFAVMGEKGLDRGDWAVPVLTMRARDGQIFS